MGLQIINLSKKFDDKIIFDEFNYDFPQTGIVAISGDSGKGKTTLLRMISRLDNDYSGNILNNDSVSYAFQEYRLFPSLTAKENVLICCSDLSNEMMVYARTLLTKLGFSDEDQNLYPAQLSGGMKQRVSLARAFFKKSDILLLDEPTKELDDENRDIVLSMVKEQSLNRLVLYVSHNKDEIAKLNAITITI